MFWTHEPQAPWQTPEWLEQMRARCVRTNSCRMIENRFVTSEENFHRHGLVGRLYHRPPGGGRCLDAGVGRRRRECQARLTAIAACDLGQRDQAGPPGLASHLSAEP